MINSRLLSIAFKSKFFNNFFFISVNQGINFVSLILVVPYLVKTVGVEKFGIITIMQTICSFFFIVVDYGFSVTSVRKLSLSKGEKEKISEIVMDTIATKIVLIIVDTV